MSLSKLNADIGIVTPTPSSNTNFIFNGQKSNNDSNTPSNTSLYFNNNFQLQNVPRFAVESHINNVSIENLPKFMPNSSALERKQINHLGSKVNHHSHQQAKQQVFKHVIQQRLLQQQQEDTQAQTGIMINRKSSGSVGFNINAAAAVVMDSNTTVPKSSEFGFSQQFMAVRQFQSSISQNLTTKQRRFKLNKNKSQVNQTHVLDHPNINASFGVNNNNQNPYNINISGNISTMNNITKNNSISNRGGNYNSNRGIMGSKVGSNLNAHRYITDENKNKNNIAMSISSIRPMTAISREQYNHEARKLRSYLVTNNLIEKQVYSHRAPNECRSVNKSKENTREIIIRKKGKLKRLNNFEEYFLLYSPDQGQDRGKVASDSLFQDPQKFFEVQQELRLVVNLITERKQFRDQQQSNYNSNIVLKNKSNNSSISAKHNNSNSFRFIEQNDLLSRKQSLLFRRKSDQLNTTSSSVGKNSGSKNEVLIKNLNDKGQTSRIINALKGKRIRINFKPAGNKRYYGQQQKLVEYKNQQLQVQLSRRSSMDFMSNRYSVSHMDRSTLCEKFKSTQDKAFSKDHYSKHKDKRVNNTSSYGQINDSQQLQQWPQHQGESKNSSENRNGFFVTMNKDIEHEVGHISQVQQIQANTSKNTNNKKSLFQKQRASLDEQSFRKDIDISKDLKALLKVRENKRNVNYMYRDEEVIVLRSSKHFSNKNRARTSSQALINSSEDQILQQLSPKSIKNNGSQEKIASASSMIAGKLPSQYNVIGLLALDQLKKNNKKIINNSKFVSGIHHRPKTAIRRPLSQVKKLSIFQPIYNA
ncbi:UNKNOWN [Stylonychia lemnae]|uniref:Uncharacterized protein n=1 Tax=Stylonychia lemnae TaxID=5949 RepID=A0A078AGE9_STYLE|nr:UNKNOWN [Stylonychia lemnae]|eukprot:CDW79913.1 UNKNOWN [Stylonychia lemnae]